MVDISTLSRGMMNTILPCEALAFFTEGKGALACCYPVGLVCWFRVALHAMNLLSLSIFLENFFCLNAINNVIGPTATNIQDAILSKTLTGS